MSVIVYDVRFGSPSLYYPCFGLSQRLKLLIIFLIRADLQKSCFSFFCGLYLPLCWAQLTTIYDIR